jgi:hypothetical protein
VAASGACSLTTSLDGPPSTITSGLDTEGFVLKVRIMSAKVIDYEGIKTLLLRKADEQFFAYLTCGWMLATVAKTRARIGWRSRLDGVRSS